MILPDDFVPISAVITQSIFRICLPSQKILLDLFPVNNTTPPSQVTIILPSITDITTLRLYSICSHTSGFFCLT